MLDLIKTFAPGVELKYNKFTSASPRTANQTISRCSVRKRTAFRVEIHLKESPEIDQQLDEAGLDAMDYDKRWGAYRVRLTKADIKKHSELLLRLLKMSYRLDVDSGLVMKAEA